MNAPHEPGEGKFSQAFGVYETVVVVVLIVLMGIVILSSTVDLAVVLGQDLLSPPMFRLNVDDLLEVLGSFMMILIGLELLETVKIYLSEHHIRVETVLVVGLIAIGRKFIILDLKKYEPMSLVGLAVMLAALALAFYVVRRPSSPLAGAQE